MTNERGPVVVALHRQKHQQRDRKKENIWEKNKNIQQKVDPENNE